MKYSILYVDDEKINLNLFKAVFKRNYNVYIAESGNEGLDILKSNKIDIILTDQRMPGMTGVEFLSKVNDKFPSVPPHRLLTSAYSKPESINKAFTNYQLAKFIPKPWKVNELKEIFNNVLK
jgi:response regulator RpfG family c-di-GMP phosphodiesterase